MEKGRRDAQEGTRNFTVVLAELDGGSFNIELGEEQRELLSNLEDLAQSQGKSGKAKGEIVIRVKYIVESNGVMQMIPDVTVKAPKRVRASTHAWVTTGGNVTFDNPRQRKLGLEDVSRRPETTGRKQEASNGDA